MVMSLRLIVAGDENGGVARRRRDTLVRASPLRCMARGSRVSVDCCCEHVGLCPGREPSERHLAARVAATEGSS